MCIESGIHTDKWTTAKRGIWSLVLLLLLFNVQFECDSSNGLLLLNTNLKQSGFADITGAKPCSTCNDIMRAPNTRPAANHQVASAQNTVRAVNCNCSALARTCPLKDNNPMTNATPRDRSAPFALTTALIALKSELVDMRTDSHRLSHTYAHTDTMHIHIAENSRVCLCAGVWSRRPNCNQL